MRPQAQRAALWDADQSHAERRRGRRARAVWKRGVVGEETQHPVASEGLEQVDAGQLELQEILETGHWRERRKVQFYIYTKALPVTTISAAEQEITDH